MAHKIIQYLNQYKDILTEIVGVLKEIAGVDNGNHIYYWKSKGLSDEELILLKHLIMELLHTYFITVLIK